MPTNIPKYQSIAETIAREIDNGTYGPGAKLPGEKAIGERFEVTRTVARQAARQLVAWGKARSRQGSGLYVRDDRPIIRDGIRRLGSDTWPAGQSIWTADAEGRSFAVDQVEVSVTSDVPAAIRAMLALRDDESAVRRSRRFLMDGKAVQYSVSWLPSFAADTQIAQRDTGPGGTYARLAEIGHRPVHFREDSRVIPGGPEITQLLDLDDGVAVVEIVRTALDAEKTPVEVNEMTIDSSAYILRYEWDA